MELRLCIVCICWCKVSEPDATFQLHLWTLPREGLHLRLCDTTQCNPPWLIMVWTGGRLCELQLNACSSFLHTSCWAVGTGYCGPTLTLKRSALTSPQRLTSSPFLSWWQLECIFGLLKNNALKSRISSEKKNVLLYTQAMRRIKKFYKFNLKTEFFGLGTVVHTCNPSDTQVLKSSGMRSTWTTWKETVLKAKSKHPLPKKDPKYWVFRSEP